MRRIGFVESNRSGSGFDALRAARKLGLYVTFFNCGLDRYHATPGGTEVLRDCVDEFVSCPTHELAPLLAAVKEVEARQPLDALLSVAEYEVVPAAEVARRLGLPGPDPDAVRIARNKADQRRRWAQRGVPIPAFRAVTTAEQAARAAEEIGLPCVVKPADETSGTHVVRCTTVAEVIDGFAAVRSEPTNRRGQPRHPEVLVEECLVGFEVSVEVLAQAGSVAVLGVTDKLVGGGNRFIELGHSFPTSLPDPIRVELEQAAVAATMAVGFDLGIAHVELKYTAKGPMLIEINPRPAGDQITELMDRSLGLSTMELVIRQYLGESVGAIEIDPVRGAAIRYLTASPGVVTGVSGVDIAAAVPGVCEAVVAVEPGERVNPLRVNEDRVGHVLATANDPYLAGRIAEAAAQQITVSTAAADSNLVMVMPYKAYIRKAQAEGFRISAIWDPAEADRLYGRAEAPEYLKEVAALADDFRLVDFTDRAAYADAIRAAVTEFGADHVWHVGSEDSMMLAYEVADELGKAVNSPRSVALLNDKLAMRTLLRDKGISSVRFATADRWQDVAALLADFTLPVVVKPTTLSASKGTFLLTDPADLPAWGEMLAAYQYDGPLLIEEYLRGPEFSVETLTVRGEHQVIGVTRKLLGPLPHFVERGHLFGEPDSAQTSQVAALAVELLDAVGYQCGPAHTEVILTEDGPRIVESQARLGGDKIPDIIQIAQGFDIKRAMFAALAGRAPRRGPMGSVGHIAYLSLPTGILRSVSGVDEVRDLDFVDTLNFPFSVGDAIPETVSSKTRHGFVILTGSDDAAQAMARADRVRELIKVEVTP
jgi:biotin carboxylase